jgi:hypothetical protein
LPSMPGERRSQSRLSLSEVMTIVVAFHGSGFRTFKAFYTLCVLPHWRRAFPNLVSYSRFIELMPWCLLLLCCFLHTHRRLHRHRVHRLNPPYGVSSCEGARTQGLPRAGAMG